MKLVLRIWTSATPPHLSVTRKVVFKLVQKWVFTLTSRCVCALAGKNDTSSVNTHVICHRARFIRAKLMLGLMCKSSYLFIVVLSSNSAMGTLKTWFKRNSHSYPLRTLSRFGMSMIRLYENSNHNPDTNGEYRVLEVFANHNLKVAVDVGANEGEYTLRLHKVAPTCSIYSIEPGKEAYKQLQAKTDGIVPVITICTGLYSKVVVKSLSRYASTTHSTLFPDDLLRAGPTSVQEVELKTGDLLFTEQYPVESIDLLKLDTEGSEYEILKGFEKMLIAGKIRAVQFEYGKRNIVVRKLLIDFFELLEPLGFTIGKVYPKSVEFGEYNVNKENLVDGNYLAVRKEERELIQDLRG